MGRLRGFAAMDKDKLRAISSMGGQVVQSMGLAHQFTSEEAREAGKKGGAKVSANRKFMSRIGKLGTKARKVKRKKVSDEAI